MFCVQTRRFSSNCHFMPYFHVTRLFYPHSSHRFWVRNGCKEVTLLAMDFIKQHGDKKIYMQFMLIYPQIAGKVAGSGSKRTKTEQEVQIINILVFQKCTGQFFCQWRHILKLYNKMLREIENWMKQINSTSTALKNVQHILEASLKA